MELNSEIVTTPPRAAATVIMLRDGAAGLEVFLLKRHGLSDVLGGAYVFPGGKVDAADALLGSDAQLDQNQATLQTRLNEPQTSAADSAALYVAAIREAFEEAGVLFAQDAAGESASAEQTMRATELARQGMAFDEVLTAMSLRLRTQLLTPWSRWITPRQPSVMNKRFDTRFFIAALPEGQIAQHDNHEATESVWLSPRAALEQYWQRQIELAPPQIMSLAHLSRYVSVQTSLAAAQLVAPALIEPEAFEHEGQRVICYPGDPRHSISQRAMPGPTRLRYVNKRFEPLDGFETLFV